MRHALAIAALVVTMPLLSASSCATTGEPEVRLVSVNVPVATPCVPKGVEDPPAYPDSDEALAAAPDAVERFRLLALGRLERIKRLAITEPILASCRKP